MGGEPNPKQHVCVRKLEGGVGRGEGDTSGKGRDEREHGG